MINVGDVYMCAKSIGIFQRDGNSFMFERDSKVVIESTVTTVEDNVRYDVCTVRLIDGGQAVIAHTYLFDCFIQISA